MQRVLELIVVGNSRSGEAMLNRLNGGLTQLGRNARRQTNELSLMDRQLMAIGTTARYALAGSLVFGITGAIQRLTDFNNQLGVTAGLLTQMGSGGNIQTPSSSTIQQVGNQAQLIANQVGIATDDVQSYMSRFFSTFSYENPKSRRAITDMKAFTTEVAKLQALMGAEAGDPQQLAGGIASFINQIPGGRNNVGKSTNRVANLITYLTQKTPNITGRDISRDIGRIGSTMSLTGLTPEQTFAIWGQAGKAGGASSVIGRGIAQMLNNLLKVTSPAQRAAYAQAGLPTDPNALRQRGAFNVLQALMRSAQTGPISIRNRAVLQGSEDTDPGAALDAAGIRGINLKQVYGIFTRQESARQFVNLLAQGGVRGLQNYLKAQKKAEDANLAFARENEALRYRQLARFNIARQNLSLSVARGVDYPLEHIVAPPIIHASNFLAGHSKARIAVDAALGAVLLRATARRFLRARRGGGASAAGAAIAAEELPALVSGQGGGQGGAPLGTRADPIWVMISPASWLVGSPGGFSTPTGGGGKTPVGFFKKLGRFIPVGALGADAGLATTGIGLPLAVLGAAAYLGDKYDPNRGGVDPLRSTKLNRALDQKYFGGGMNRPLYFNGALDVTTKLVDNQGRVISIQTHKGVPVKQWGASPSMPTSKGKNGSARGK